MSKQKTSSRNRKKTALHVRSEKAARRQTKDSKTTDGDRKAAGREDIGLESTLDRKLIKPVLITGAIVLLVFVWSYLPTLLALVEQWNRIPDYSHGFLVIPMALMFLWLKRDTFPGVAANISWMGASLIVLAGVLRCVGAYYYLEALQSWSIPIWLAGFVWMFFGWKTFKWSLPGIAFLIFMVPLPFVVERMLSLPLQQISTQMSLFTLQCLGQPAVAQGTTIVLGPNTLEVARACSGLRIFFGVAALAYAFMILFSRPISTKLMLAVAILPIALLANSLRIVVTGLLYQTGFDETARQFSHDMAGFVMIPVAAGFFALTLIYLDKLFPAIKTIDAQTLVRSQTGRRSATP